MWDGPQKIFSMLIRLYTLRDAELNIPTEISFIRSKEVETTKKSSGNLLCVFKKNNLLPFKSMLLFSTVTSLAKKKYSLQYA